MLMDMIILSFFGVLTGITASLFGFGGGFVVVPLLYHLLGVNNINSMYVAISTSTAIMVINSINATYKHNKNNNIIWEMVYPLIIYISIGALFGVLLAGVLNSQIIRWFFILYMIYTIYECVAKKKFITHNQSDILEINAYLKLIFGILIGIIATVLGVGGSVMTVPLMRKLGLKMKNAVAMANPLSFPVGFVGAIGYITSAYIQKVNLGSNYIGYIYLPAFIILVIGGIIGVPIGSRLINKIPDKVHAKTYIALLCLVLIAMLIK
jgi:uncharacterized protein